MLTGAACDALLPVAVATTPVTASAAAATAASSGRDRIKEGDMGRNSLESAKALLPHAKDLRIYPGPHAGERAHPSRGSTQPYEPTCNTTAIFTGFGGP